MAQEKEYDVVVIGSGSGAAIADAALAQGDSVALIDRGPVGGTCLNVGCIPSKVLIASADRVMEVREGEKLGVRAAVEAIDFGGIMRRMRAIRDRDVEHTRHGLHHVEGLDYYPTVAHFVGPRSLEVDGRRVSGRKVFIVAGARPFIPPIRGLDEVGYLDNASLLELDRAPESLVIVGGGYIACEYAHFFSAMGTRVMLVQRNPRLVPEEEPEISDLLRAKLAERVELHVGYEAFEAGRTDGGAYVVARHGPSGAHVRLEGERILVAAGRRPNTDLLQVERAGIAVDERGYIRVDQYLQTNVPNVWALGDVIGVQMFKHSANRAATYAWHNSQHDHAAAIDLSLTPHAVFTWPQIASVGMREEEARHDHDVLVGRAGYSDVARGLAIAEVDSFAKIIVDAETERILGCHIIGPEASTLIQEVVNVMARGEEAGALAVAMRIHP
ncbi:MAG: dihydrolipoyl dehydrogenase, partial [Chloroflexi bacterium]|nr:dihydrolipoyl dehydrogenase [Chloroflexota bacterium]